MNPLSFSDREKQKKANLFSAVFHLCLFSHAKRYISLLTQSNKPNRVLIEPEVLLQDFVAFKTLLQNLSINDVSNDSTFLEHLSQTWQNIKKNFRPLRPSNTDKPSIQIEIEHFIDQMDAFPKGEDHSIGFYLEGYQKDTWTPFPFIGQLAKLHHDFQADPVANHLQAWILLVEDIIEDLSL